MEKIPYLHTMYMILLSRVYRAVPLTNARLAAITA